MTYTCVSAYFHIKNKHGNKYIDEWFKNTLSINCPYVFFTTKEYIDIIKSYRKDLPTYFIEYNIEDFYTYQFKDRMITHPIDCPSVELNLIWNEKLFMIQKAYEINPFNSEWFQWIDAGICSYRNECPPNILYPNVNKVDNLPKDKFIYEASEHYYIPQLVTNTNYYHYISGTFMLHKTIIHDFVNIYKDYLEKLVDKNNIWTDQLILTHIYKNNPDLFFKLTIGHGEMIRYLFS
jgi:hypothetical protein